jgi:tRNA threonylcarbamoyladenosine biosynthesis protein TsaE
LAHVDLYRLGEGGTIGTLGLEDYLDGQTVLAIEWADYAEPLLPADRLEIELRHRTPSVRRVSLHATGPQTAAVLLRLRRGHRAHPRSNNAR